MSFDNDDEALAQALELHPELQDWTDEDYDRAETEQGVNWHAHLLCDSIVLRRMADPSLPDAEVIRELEACGETKLEAIHRVANEVVLHIWALHWLAAVEQGRNRPEELPEELRGRSTPTNEELNERIRALLRPSPPRGQRRRRRRR